MYNVDKIEININNIFSTIDVLIIPDTLKAYKDGKEINITKDYIEKILKVISLWDKEYNNNNIIDAPEYDIRIYYDNKIDRYYAKGLFPYNYNELLELLGDLDG